jgi:hypothetical protein
VWGKDLVSDDREELGSGGASGDLVSGGERSGERLTGY